MFSCIHLKFMFNEGPLQRLIQGTNLDVPNASKTVPIKLGNYSFTKARPVHGQSLNVVILLNVGEHDIEPIQKGERVSAYSQTIFQASPIPFWIFGTLLGWMSLNIHQGLWFHLIIQSSSRTPQPKFDKSTKIGGSLIKCFGHPMDFTIRLLVAVLGSMGPNPS